MMTERMFNALVAGGFSLLIAVTVGLICWSVSADGKQHRAGYAAWVKQTDNPRHLTFEEWDALVRSTKPSDSTVFIYTR